jgi:hypothetical protein
MYDQPLSLDRCIAVQLATCCLVHVHLNMPVRMLLAADLALSCAGAAQAAAQLTPRLRGPEAAELPKLTETAQQQQQQQQRQCAAVTALN